MSNNGVNLISLPVHIECSSILLLFCSLHAVGFLVNTLHNLSGVLPMVLYISYTCLMAWCLFLAMGTIGFLASYIFTIKIFEAVKAD